jgi:hypothetical protein
VAATRAPWRGSWRGSWRRLAGFIGSLTGGLLAAGSARAIDLPEDRADAMVHVYDGGGVKATGPAILIRKKLAERVSLAGSYYVDKVSNASIDVVTTASPYKESRKEYSIAADYVYRDAQITLSTSKSTEPDYVAAGTNLDVTQEVFGGLTSVSLGFTRGIDEVGKRNSPGFVENARHWKYRFGVTQILTPRWLMSANFEALSDDGYLGSPYRSARVFGAYVPERNPRTRSGRAIKFRSINDLGARNALRAEYRYYVDTWDIKAHTMELGTTRYFGDAWLADASLRYHTQSKALFYSDDAQSETIYVSRNRQLGSFNNIGLGGRFAYTWVQVPGRYDIKANASYQWLRFKFKDFTDVRTGQLYGYNAHVMQLFVSATF